MGPIGCPETTVRFYNHSLHISPGESSSLLNTDIVVHNIQSVSCLHISYVNTFHAYCQGYSQAQVSYRYAPHLQSLARCGYLKFSLEYVFTVVTFSLDINSDWLSRCRCNERMVHSKSDWTKVLYLEKCANDFTVLGQITQLTMETCQ